MTNLSRRLTKLEGRFGVHDDPIEHVINFVDSDGTITGTLRISHVGERTNSRWERRHMADRGSGDLDGPVATS